tara:strand:- start:10288 stop:11967 length:1680 start_codon:yes stop_codon:yes gene_type:complete
MNVSEIIAAELKKNSIKDIFMLTGYGAMYLNDAIEQSGIRYYAARNEAAAPMMAEAYAKSKNQIGAVCVTAGPGATNALPGLAEAFVDSAPVIIISGQVENEFCADTYKKLNLRTLGTAEFSITRILDRITKYSVKIDKPKNCLYLIQKAIYEAKSGRFGPVWVEIPLDIQSIEIKNPKELKKFLPRKRKIKTNYNNINKIIKKIQSSKKPLLAIGNGIKQSNQIKTFKKIIKKSKIPFVTTRFANDLMPYSNKQNLGLCGIKGVPHVKKITDDCDLFISLGCRFSPTFCLGNPKTFAKNAYCISINNDVNELKLGLKKIDLKIQDDLETFLPQFYKKLSKVKIPNFGKWQKLCGIQKKKDIIPNLFSKKSPIDLYRFMYLLGEQTKKNHTLITDAGSNYYIGGQAWHFNNGGKEISSGANAAMGLSLPLSIGAAVAEKNNQILSVTGDGSIELNIQELKTISHYKLNIKTFVINNGGYVSMKKWQDNFFAGNRLDTEDLTGVGTLNFKKIANAFDLKYEIIKKEDEINKKLEKLMSNNIPYLVEVVTDPNQKIYGKEF